MDKTYDPKLHEEKIYTLWEKGGYFTPKIDKTKKPFTILIPPPNTSGKMHIGNVLMIAIEDILIRWHRMMGDPTLWIPGTDHAGTETQITFERELAKKGKSRLDFSRQELYGAIWKFVQENKHQIENQIKRMGASVDWTRYTFTLDQKVIDMVYETFKKMHNDGLIYRGEHIVNYCVKCGTTYSDVEVKHKETQDSLYFIKYKLVDQKAGEPEYLEVATVRPETITVDTHLAVNPKDKKKAIFAGRKLFNPITEEEMEIIHDPFVDPKFGTGIVKLTPAHDKNDYDVAIKNNLPIKSVIDWSGRLTDAAGEYKGLTVTQARIKVAQDLTAKGLVVKIEENYEHKVPVCKAGHEIEQITVPNWFVRVDDENKSFKKPALDVVLEGKVKIFPKWREKTYVRWMEEMRDWAISRQNVWGIRIPIWYEVENGRQLHVWFLDKNGEQKNGILGQFLENGHTIEEITNGLQRVFAIPGVKYTLEKEEGKTYLPETDTFDTWFSSGQWPLVTLGYPDSEDFKYFYPTNVLETGWEIIRLWVSRMIMFGIYLTGQPPFEYVYLHGLVRAIDGHKMSKSLGNIINPEEYIEKYGVDALRMGLISGTANGKDFSFPQDKVIGYRNFTNKVWNMARFFIFILEKNDGEIKMEGALKDEDKEILQKLNDTTKSVNKSLEGFRFADAGETIYQFVWHELADKYIEQIKNREDKTIALGVFAQVFSTSLKLLHPFMPFVTETIWQTLRNTKGVESFFKEEVLVITKWPAE